MRLNKQITWFRVSSSYLCSGSKARSQAMQTNSLDGASFQPLDETTFHPLDETTLHPLDEKEELKEALKVTKEAKEQQEVDQMKKTGEAWSSAMIVLLLLAPQVAMIHFSASLFISSKEESSGEDERM